MAYAIIRSGDKQFRVEEGGTVRLPSINKEAGETVELDALVVAEWGEFLNPNAQHVPERTGVSAEPDPVVLVHDAGEVGGDQVATAGDETCQPVGERAGHDVQDRGDEQVVVFQRGGGGDDVDPNAGIEKRAVPVQCFLTVAEPVGGVGVELGGPPGIPVEDDGGPGAATYGAGHRCQVTQGGAEAGNGPEDLAVLTGVRDHGGVVLLGAGWGLAPLEEADRVRAVGDVGE